MHNAMFYKLGYWPTSADVPRVGRAPEAYVPPYPEGATEAEISKILQDAGLITIDANGVVDNTQLVIRLVFNGTMRDENKEANRARNDACYEATQNAARDAEAQAKSQGKVRSANQQIIAKAVQLSHQQKKALESFLTNMMVKRMMANKSADNNRKKVEGK